MTEYLDLEIGLHRHDGSAYRVEPRLLLPGYDAELRPPANKLYLASFDAGTGAGEEPLAALWRTAGDPLAHGDLLGKALFSEGPVRDLYLRARQEAARPGRALRIRLYVGASAPELNRVRWETLRIPEEPAHSLATDANVIFSRYLSSWDWRPTLLIPKGELRALVVIANPLNVPPGTAAVNVVDELGRACTGLRGVASISALCRLPPGAAIDPDVRVAGPPTLNGLISALREGYDLLYFVAHGQLTGQIPYVWLEDNAGQLDAAPAYEERDPLGRVHAGLVTEMAGLRQLPRLAVLVSCQSAGAGGPRIEGDLLLSLAPRLVELGIPAVLGMQGNVTMDSMSRFVPAFFAALKEAEIDGHIDEAVAAARGVLYRDTRPDWWMPVLFSRLLSGAIWYTPGFAGDRAEFETWPDLVSAIKNDACTPIVGPGLLESIFGSIQDIANRWADGLPDPQDAAPPGGGPPGVGGPAIGQAESAAPRRLFPFPMAQYQRRLLPQVARYLATMQSLPFMRETLQEELRTEIRRRHPAVVAALPPNASALDIISAVGKAERAADLQDPFKIIAKIPASIYLTATPDNLLYDALTEEGKKPQRMVCPWYQQQAGRRKGQSKAPTVQQPLVYHLFGYLGEPESLVLSEDDYFRYLIWMSQDQTRGQSAAGVLPAVSGALNKNALMFLGFKLDEWDFRVLLHSLVNPDGGIRSGRHTSVAVQVIPEADACLEPGLARKYLTKYFAQFPAQFPAVKSSVYWGTAETFLADLWERHTRWLPAPEVR